MKKRALITGSSRGIGRAIAIELAKNGYDCVINCLHREDKAKEVVEEIRSMGRQAFFVKADISSYEQCTYMFDEMKRQFGGIELLVNNAGIAINGLFQDTSLSEWQSIINTNVNGLYNCTSQAISHMLEVKRGNIINISSIWGMVGAAMEVAYSTSKGAVISFTKSLAKEVGFSGIRVNCIAPGGIDTDMLSGLSDDIIEQVIGETPAGRLGNAKDIAELAVFLASERASFITGQIISPNGGLVI